MSRTKHHRMQKANKCGVDFGARYNCDKQHGGGTGPYTKKLAAKERRSEGKKIVHSEQ